MKTILLTGAAGFVGSNVAETLLLRGDRVIALDSFDPYYDPAVKRANVAEVQAVPDAADRFHFVEGDIRDEPLLTRLLGEHKIDHVVHMAGLGGVRGSLDFPARYASVNLKGTITLLEAVRRQPVKTFVFASTSSVYGRSAGAFSEDMACDRPLSPYAATKRAAEMMGYTYHQLYGLSFTALRLFTAYGPRNRPDMMAFKIMDSIATGREIPLYDGGEMHRDWTCVHDIVEGVIAAVDRPLGYEVINLGRGEPVRLADFVQCVESVAGGRAVLRPAPAPLADAPYTCARIDKARELLGFHPSISVQEGVELLWRWYQQRHARPVTATRPEV